MSTEPLVTHSLFLIGEGIGKSRTPALHEREGLEVAIYDGRQHHATAGVDDPGVPFRRVSQRGVYGVAASGRYRAVIATSAGRIALPAAYSGARRAGAAWPGRTMPGGTSGAGLSAPISPPPPVVRV